jgi:RecB family endonuclease NucS
MKGKDMIDEKEMKFRTENELRDYIAENFSQFFPFKFLGKELPVGRKAADLMGEDYEAVYIIEIKNGPIGNAAFAQIKRYMETYRTITSKLVRGILMGSSIKKTLTLDGDLQFVKIRTGNSGRYLLRDIDNHLYEEMRIKAIEEHISLKDVFSKLIQLWIDGKIDINDCVD